ncbi:MULTISPECIES: mercuric transporter MerT family protein [Limnobacter]|uniref:Mercuric transport protein MerT n=1 Tax=Limnobacter litoralis TaxID=481366 RepID=A0ABQ5YQ46_9BURK|nr:MULTISPECIES: mercuric transporter MerT family protein [Limnobacter]GLR26735.1 mercury transporter [Limnobacter litoralis]HEX5484504.1 mercuric transporter MerT family protein [Limnobacter sp.]
MKSVQNTGTLIGSALAAFAASICCLGPLLLLAVGVGGSSSLSIFAALEPYRPAFIVITLGLLAFAYYRMFKLRSDCEACSKGQKMAFWGIALLALVMLATPWFV